MKKRLFPCFSVFIVLLIFQGCRHDGMVREGVIEYSAEIVDQKHPMASFAPDKMIVSFKDNKSKAEMTAGMGIFYAAFIADPEQKTLTQIVKILRKKVYLIQSKSDLEKENATQVIEIIPSNETKLIAGYKCKKVHVVVKDTIKNEFDVFYTNEVKIRNPNFSTPFHMIDGVLMEYQIKKFGLEMKFTAQNLKQVDIDEDTFQIPADYSAVEPEEMNSLFSFTQ